MEKCGSMKATIDLGTFFFPEGDIFISILLGCKKAESVVEIVCRMQCG